VKVVKQMELKELKSKAKLIRPLVRIGKNGITETQVNDIKKHLKKRKLIKIKLLKSFRKEETTDIAQDIAEKTDSKVIHIIGFTFVLYKK